MICIPKLVLEIQDLLLPVTVLLPRLDYIPPAAGYIPSKGKYQFSLIIPAIFCPFLVSAKMSTVGFYSNHGQMGLSLTSCHLFFRYIFYMSTWIDVRGRILVSTRPTCYRSRHTQYLQWNWMRHISSPTHCMMKVRPSLDSPHWGVIPPNMPEYQYPWFWFWRAFKIY